MDGEVFLVSCALRKTNCFGFGLVSPGIYGDPAMLPMNVFLLESGFDELNGVDLQKGCYIGQELTARTKYRGLIKKHLFPVRIDGPAPAPGTILSLDGKEAGEMRSSRDSLGLALLRLDGVGEDRSFAAGETTLFPIRPDWMRIEQDNPSPAPREGGSIRADRK